MGCDYLDRLNEPQRQAVTTIDGPLLVLAGAGTGKTGVITARIAWMIESGIPPSNILGVTFTNKAAREMRERLDALIGRSAEKVTLGTFHSVCGRILRRYIHLAGNYNASFGIMDEQDQSGTIREAAGELGYGKEDYPEDMVASFISTLKNDLVFADEYEPDPLNPYQVACGKIYRRYQELAELRNTVDFDDMLILPVRIFRNHPDILAKYREQYRYILVDEYQDTNSAQFELIRMLAAPANNLCVVGDDDQSIYAWRGADVANILEFPHVFPGTKEIKLEQNYRSTNKILKAANAVISRNGQRYDKNLWSANGDGENIKIVCAETGDDEARFIAGTVANLVARGEYSLSDFAVLYRSNYLSRGLETAFREQKIRPKIVGGQEFFQRREVKDAAAYLKLPLNKRDDQSLLRIISVPPRGIGDKSIVRLRELAKAAPGTPLLDVLGNEAYLKNVSGTAAKESAALHDTIEKYAALFKSADLQLMKTVHQYLTEVGYLGGIQRIYHSREETESRLENINEFINCIGNFESDRRAKGESPMLADFLESYSLMDDNDRTDDELRDAPVLSTVHAAKGLEYPFVFLMGLENNIFPHERALEENPKRGLDEERRLFYVAVTRAKQTLVLSYARRRMRYGSWEPTSPSQFLECIPKDISESNVPDDFVKYLSDDEKKRAYADILKMIDNA